jgi:putative hydrolase of the HAD superfamily
MMDLLEAAASRNLCLGLLSDYPAEKKLRAMGLAGRFSAVLSAKDPRVGLFKPSPRGIQVMLQDLGVGPESAVYVGDRPSVDGEAARRAGVKCVILGRRQGRKGRGWIGVPDVPALRAWLRI